MPIIDSDGNVANFWAYNPNYKEYKVLFEKIDQERYLTYKF